MKITSVEPLLIDRFCYVRVEPDTGITGIGEAGTRGHMEASAAAVRKFAEYLAGKDPRPIEHRWNVMQRAHHFSGTAINDAVPAIDIALRDIKGKLYNVPVRELLGGKMRDTAQGVWTWEGAHARGPCRRSRPPQIRRLHRTFASQPAAR